MRDKCAINDNTVLFSSLLLDACIVPVSVPVCHLDSRQLQQQPPPSLMNNQQQLQHQQNNPPHLAYQQANHHSYTTVTTSNQHGPSHLPSGGGVMGAHQQGPVPPHLQQQVSPLSSSEISSYACSLSLFLSCLPKRASVHVPSVLISRYIEVVLLLLLLYQDRRLIVIRDESSVVRETESCRFFFSAGLTRMAFCLREIVCERFGEKEEGQKNRQLLPHVSCAGSCALGTWR